MSINSRIAVASTTLALSLGLACSTAVAQSTNSAENDELSSLLGPDETPAESEPDAADTTKPASDAPKSDADTPPASAAATKPETTAAEGTPPVATVPVETLQTPSSDSKTARSRRAIEEVIVTAQRKEESAQDVPISITVFKPEDIAKANITNSADLATYTPSLSVNPRFGSENASFAIRGFTQDLRTTASVGTYFAEVVAPRGQSSQTSGDGAGPGALFDLTNVQVLKGPQGTLFGRNTTGGAVLITPQKPTDDLGGFVEISGGDYGALRQQAVLNLPATSWAKLRFGIDHNKRDGHLINVARVGKDKLGDTNYTALRASLVLDLTDDIENYSIASYVNSNTGGYPSRLFACNNNMNPEMNPFFALINQPCNRQLQSQTAAGQNGFYDVVSTVPTPGTIIKEKRAINTTTWRLSDTIQVKNILAYAHLFTHNGTDIFGTQFTETAGQLGVGGLPGIPGVSGPPVDPRREFSIGDSVRGPNGEPVTSQATTVEEIQIQGTSLGGRFNWQTGAYFEISRPDGFSGNTSASFLYCDASTLEGDPANYNCNDPANGQLGSVLQQFYKTTYRNKAAYAQSTFNITDKFGITAGLRYTIDDTKGYGIKTRYNFSGTVRQPPSTAISSPAVSTRAPTWLLESDYKPIEDVLIYAKYVRGYRQGSVVLATDPGVDTYKAEKVDTYEVGAKTTFDFIVPGRFNVAVFYNDFRNQQLQGGFISPSAGPTVAIFNAGKSRIAGLEADGYFLLLDSLTATVSLSYLDTKLISQANNQAAAAAAGGPLAGLTFTPIAAVGDELPFAAKYSVVGGLTYRLPAPESFGEMEFGLTQVYTGKRRASASGSSPFAVLDPFSLLNLNFAWRNMFGKPFEFSVYATNVLDEEYRTYVGGTFNVLGVETQQSGLPRMIGSRLRYSFGN